MLCAAEQFALLERPPKVCGTLKHMAAAARGSIIIATITTTIVTTACTANTVVDITVIMC